MLHSEFKEAWKDGRLQVDVDRSTARLVTAGYLPKRYFWATTFWGLVWIGLIIAGPLLFFFIVGGAE
ncbi:MAG: hypothetical protein JWO20_2332 [Candidatus Angelobacter sp.]|nr:hypothetical protein [Candidatus Angelobacter sp.]